MELTRSVAVVLSLLALGAVVALLADQASLYRKSVTVPGMVDGTLEGGVWKWEFNGKLTTAAGVAQVKGTGSNSDMCSERANTFKAAQAFGLLSAVFALLSLLWTVLRSQAEACMLHFVMSVWSLVLVGLLLAAFFRDYEECVMPMHLEVRYSGKTAAVTMPLNVPQLSDGTDAHYAIPLAAVAWALNILSTALCCCGACRATKDGPPEQNTAQDTEMGGR